MNLLVLFTLLLTSKAYSEYAYSDFILNKALDYKLSIVNNLDDEKLLLSYYKESLSLSFIYWYQCNVLQSLDGDESQEMRNAKNIAIIGDKLNNPSIKDELLNFRTADGNLDSKSQIREWFVFLEYPIKESDFVDLKAFSKLIDMFLGRHNQVLEMIEEG